MYICQIFGDFDDIFVFDCIFIVSEESSISKSLLHIGHLDMYVGSGLAVRTDTFQIDTLISKLFYGNRYLLKRSCTYLTAIVLNRRFDDVFKKNINHFFENKVLKVFLDS